MFFLIRRLLRIWRQRRARNAADDNPRF